MVAIVASVILGIVQSSQRFDITGFTIVASMVALGTTEATMVISGFVIRKKRHELYSRASELVVRGEPCTRLLQLAQGGKGAIFLSLPALINRLTIVNGAWLTNI